MENKQSTAITIETTVLAPIEKVWKYFNEPQHIMRWCAASDDWHTPTAETDFRVGGISKTRMEAKDGSFGFDFEYEFTKITHNEIIEYRMTDGRTVSISFEQVDDAVKIIETFEAENQNSIDDQRDGWQAILNNFKKYVESN